MWWEVEHGLLSASMLYGIVIWILRLFLFLFRFLTSEAISRCPWDAKEVPIASWANG